MKKFIALDADKYKLGEGIVPVSLSWETKTIKGWCLNLAWSDGTEEILIDLPDDVAENIDNYLTEYESKK